MARSRVKDPTVTPGRSEFSHGPGLEAPARRGAIKTPFEEHKAIFRTDTLDAGSFPNTEEHEDGKA